MYILKILRCLWLARCILICCSSVSLLLVVCGVFNSVKVFYEVLRCKVFYEWVLVLFLGLL